MTVIANISQLRDFILDCDSLKSMATTVSLTEIPDWEMGLFGKGQKGNSTASGAVVQEEERKNQQENCLFLQNIDKYSTSLPSSTLSSPKSAFGKQLQLEKRRNTTCLGKYNSKVATTSGSLEIVGSKYVPDLIRFYNNADTKHRRQKLEALAIKPITPLNKTEKESSKDKNIFTTDELFELQEKLHLSQPAPRPKHLPNQFVGHSQVSAERAITFEQANKQPASFFKHTKRPSHIAEMALTDSTPIRSHRFRSTRPSLSGGSSPLLQYTEDPKPRRFSPAGPGLKRSTSALSNRISTYNNNSPLFSRSTRPSTRRQSTCLADSFLEPPSLQPNLITTNKLDMPHYQQPTVQSRFRDVRTDIFESPTPASRLSSSPRRPARVSRRESSGSILLRDRANSVEPGSRSAYRDFFNEKRPGSVGFFKENANSMGSNSYGGYEDVFSERGYRHNSGLTSEYAFGEESTLAFTNELDVLKKTLVDLRQRVLDHTQSDKKTKPRQVEGPEGEAKQLVERLEKDDGMSNIEIQEYLNRLSQELEKAQETPKKEIEKLNERIKVGLEQKTRSKREIMSLVVAGGLLVALLAYGLGWIYLFLVEYTEYKISPY